MVGRDDFAEVMLVGNFIDILSGNFFREGKGNFVAAYEVDTIDMIVVYGNADGACEDDEPGGDEGRFAIFKEVEMGFFEERDCEDVAHYFIFNGEVEDKAADY